MNPSLVSTGLQASKVGSLVSLRGVGKRYSGPVGEVVALRDVRLEVQPFL